MSSAPVERTPELLAAITAHTNIQFNSLLEPCIPVSHPTLNLVITTLRPGDSLLQSQTLSSPSVGLNLAGPPYPYTVEDGNEWFKIMESKFEEQMRKWAEGDWRLLREDVFHCVRDTDTGDWVGGCGHLRWAYDDLEGGEKEEAIKREDAISSGSEEATWSFGFLLNPAYGGKGVMTCVLRSLIDNYLIPTMNCHHLRSSAYEGNMGSRRVQEKNGLTWYTTVEKPIAEIRGGGTRKLWCFEWHKTPETA